MRLKFSVYCFVLMLFLISSGCKKEIVPEPYQPTNAYDAYLHGLKQAGLAKTALGKDWIQTSKKTLQEAIKISIPFKEAFYVSPSSAFAVSYNFNVKRGQKIKLLVDFKGQKPTRLFIDLFRVTGESIKEWILIASANENEKQLAFEARRNATYAARLQPELLRGGQFTVTIRSAASLVFPVSGKDRHSIGSKFGDPRDGGRRIHKGVDIFAPRDTPVLASSESRVYYAGTTRVGGKVIWLYDSTRHMYFYFAHLQSYSVNKGQTVEAGQIIGFVGNSGNAKTTPPHLHYSIVKPRESWIDPYHFIVETNETAEAISADPNLLGKWARTKAKDLSIPVKVIAASGKKYRAISPDGVTCYIPSVSVESINETIQQQTASLEQAIKEIPKKDSATMEQVDKGEKFFVFGKFKKYWLVKTHNGNTGWMQIPKT